MPERAAKTGLLRRVTGMGARRKGRIGATGVLPHVGYGAKLDKKARSRRVFRAVRRARDAQEEQSKGAMINRYGLIIGAMKAGTTTLFDHLADHPEIAGSNPKEPGFFAFDDLYREGRRGYEALFSWDPAIHKVALDGSTDYAKYPHCGDVAGRIRAYGSDFRFIYILRHPLRRIESHAQHVQHKKREVGRIDSDRDDHSLDAGVSPVSLDVSRYAMQLDQYKDYFDKGAVMITSVERLAANPQGVARAACVHLGVNPERLPANVERRNEAGQTWRARDLHPLWRAASAVAPLRAAAKALTPQSFRDRLRLKTRPATAAKGRFTLSVQEEAALTETLADDLQRLRDVYGFDFEREWGITL
jgi:hypothetical protein